MEFINGVPSYVIHWETYDRLYYQKDYEALINYQKDYIRQHPGNLRDDLMLADAYGYAGRHLLALKILQRLHKMDPYDSEYIHALVGCLRKCGFDPRAYKWRRKVPFFEEPEETLSWCLERLELNGCHMDMVELFTQMWSAGYVSLEEEELLGILKASSDVTVLEDEALDSVTIFLDKNECSHNY